MEFHRMETATRNLRINLVLIVPLAPFSYLGVPITHTRDAELGTRSSLAISRAANFVRP